MESSTQQKRLYQVWKGNNRFFCGGRLIFGPEVAPPVLSTLMVVGPAAAFCTQVILKNKRTDGVFCLPVLLVAVTATILDLIFLFMTSGRDPGIVPRNLQPLEYDEAIDTATPSMEWINGRTPHLKLPRAKDVSVNGTVVKVKYCDTCLLYRPPRASHCSVCDNCVQRFDHHCPWVGQCIGLRNYRPFFLFVSSSTFLCIYVFSLSLLNILKEKAHGKSLTVVMTKETLSVFLIIYCFIAVWFVGGLTVFHLYLISTNQTTYENFRYRYDKKENPYNRGIVANFKELLFSETPPSMNDFRSWVLEEEHTESGDATPNTGEDANSLKDRSDIEMGSNTLATGNSMPTTPDWMPNTDNNGVDDKLRRKDCEDDDAALASFLFPIDDETTDTNKSTAKIYYERHDCSTNVGQELKCSDKNFEKENDVNLASGSGENSISYETASY